MTTRCWHTECFGEPLSWCHSPGRPTSHVVAACWLHWPPSIVRVTAVHSHRNRHVLLVWLCLSCRQGFIPHRYLRTYGLSDSSWHGNTAGQDPLYSKGNVGVRSRRRHPLIVSPTIQAGCCRRDGAFTQPSKTAQPTTERHKGCCLVPEEERFCRVVHAPQRSPVDQAKSDFTWDHIPAWLFPFILLPSPL